MRFVYKFFLHLLTYKKSCFLIDDQILIILLYLLPNSSKQELVVLGAEKQIFSFMLISQNFYMLPFVVAMIRPNHIVMRPFGLVKSPSKDAAAKVGMLSVLPHTYSVSPSSVVHCVHSLCFIVRATCYN